MGKKKTGVNNSALVREIISAGIDKPSDIVAEFKKRHGRDVQKALVNAVKMGLKKTGAKQPARKVTPTDSVRGQVVNTGTISELDLAKLALKMGGVDNAIRALEELRN